MIRLRGTHDAFPMLGAILHDNFFSQKRETFMRFDFVYTTTAFQGLKTHIFENGFQSARF